MPVQPSNKGISNRVLPDVARARCDWLWCDRDGVLILARIISSYVHDRHTYLSARRGRAPRRENAIADAFIASWTGMRGVVSLAAALAIPVSLSDGTAFPYRDLILFITFCGDIAYLIDTGTLFTLFNQAQRGIRWHHRSAGRYSKTKIEERSPGPYLSIFRNKYDNELHGHAGMQKLLKHWEEKTKSFK